ncbi:MAG TPA: hypothetical protein VK465_12850 [Fibrobacteria bacterium]|nr:hypothetical protein [Fibrobacteria bacterium]
MRAKFSAWMLTVTMALPAAQAAKTSKSMAPLLAKVKAAKSQAHLGQALLAFSTRPAVSTRSSAKREPTSRERWKLPPS